MNTSLEMMNLIGNYLPKESCRILEPSAGEGDLTSYLIGIGHSVASVELNKFNYNTLLSRFPSYHHDIHRADFLTWKSDELFDFVCAVPPYRDNIDCRHISKMYTHLKKGGKVISYTLPYWVAGIHTDQSVFREWLNTKDWKIHFVEDTSYALCPKALLIIQK